MKLFTARDPDGMALMCSVLVAPWMASIVSTSPWAMRIRPPSFARNVSHLTWPVLPCLFSSITPEASVPRTSSTDPFSPMLPALPPPNDARVTANSRTRSPTASLMSYCAPAPSWALTVT